MLPFEDLLPSPDAGPEALYARGVLLDELERALAELPKEQREVFVAHEFEGRSFKELSAETGVSVNTLLSRKRYAVLHLRERLHACTTNLRNESLRNEGMNMRKKRYWIAPLAIVAIPLFIFVGGEVVMHLWNWLLPPLFGWRMLGFWQAWDCWRCAGFCSAACITAARVVMAGGASAGAAGT